MTTTEKRKGDIFGAYVGLASMLMLGMVMFHRNDVPKANSTKHVKESVETERKGEVIRVKSHRADGTDEEFLVKLKEYRKYRH